LHKVFHTWKINPLCSQDDGSTLLTLMNSNLAILAVSMLLRC
jgi:hypothetical protein